MAKPSLLLIDYNVSPLKDWDGEQMPLDVVASQPLAHILTQWLFRFGDVYLLTYDQAVLRRPFNKALLIRLLSRRRCFIRDAQGNEQRVHLWHLLRLFFNLILARKKAPKARQRILAQLSQLENTRSLPCAPTPGDAPPIYLRTDIVFGLTSGGSVTHTSGVANELARIYGELAFWATDKLPTLGPNVHLRIQRPDPLYNHIPELSTLAFNQTLIHNYQQRLTQIPRPAFIYQRYAINNFTGAALSCDLSLPLVLEYNGSEVWVHRNWAKGLQDEDTTARIEIFNLRAAHLIVVVSDVLAQELTERGIPRQRILVNPNGVDPSRYHPDLRGSQVRAKLGLEGKTIVGFIGTFGPWHGVEVLALAIHLLFKARPEWSDTLRFLLIGDGSCMPEVRKILDQYGLNDRVLLTGQIPQDEGAEHMAACDLLVSPHVPNQDGSAFFGSPTKLFEYMAMGRAIVASELGQIGDVLTHNKDAWLVPPGDPEALAQAMAGLLEDPELRTRLARAAREKAMQFHTWEQHTQRIVTGLETQIGQAIRDL